MGVQLPETQDKRLIKKAQTILGHHRAEARKYGLELDYDRDDLLMLLRTAKQCHYCKMPVGWDCEVDHYEPLAWGKRAYQLANLVVTCHRCNCMKGVLSGLEFINLLIFLEFLSPRSAEDIRRRLQGGGKAVYGKRRKNK